MSYSSANTITTVARREIHIALRNRGIMVAIVITLVLALGGIGLISWLSDRDTAPPVVAVVGMDAGAFDGTGVDASPAVDRADAETTVLDGDADAALVAGEDGWELLTEGTPSTPVLGAVDQVVSAQATDRALTSLGVAPADFAAALPPAELTTVPIGEGADEGAGNGNMGAVVTVLAGVAILLFTITLFAGNIGSRVTEEKSSRVVEIILASVRPMDFLAGKILCNSLFGLVATALIVGIAAVALQFSGLLDGIDFDWGVVGILLIGFVLGMVFFGSLYAAAGAMVQRTEDLQSTQTPILFLIMATIYVPFFGFSRLDATWMETLAWVPPFSIAVAPLQYAAGTMGLGALALSYALLAAVTVGVIWLVARVYRNAILNNGRKLSWRQALMQR